MLGYGTVAEWLTCLLVTGLRSAYCWAAAGRWQRKLSPMASLATKVVSNGVLFEHRLLWALLVVSAAQLFSSAWAVHITGRHGNRLVAWRQGWKITVLLGFWLKKLFYSGCIIGLDDLWCFGLLFIGCFGERFQNNTMQLVFYLEWGLGSWAPKSNVPWLRLIDLGFIFHFWRWLGEFWPARNRTECEIIAVQFIFRYL